MGPALPAQDALCPLAVCSWRGGDTQGWHGAAGLAALGSVARTPCSQAAVGTLVAEWLGASVAGSRVEVSCQGCRDLPCSWPAGRGWG